MNVNYSGIYFLLFAPSVLSGYSRAYRELLADTVHGVRQLERAIALWLAEEVSPLVADVADDDVPGVHQLLPLTGLELHRSHPDVLRPAGMHIYARRHTQRMPGRIDDICTYLSSSFS